MSAPGDPLVEGFSAEYRVRFDEAGPDGMARPSVFLRYAQDCAWRHSEALGFGRQWYEARGLAWLVRAIRLEQLADAPNGTALVVWTAISGFRRILARRRTTVTTAEGRLVAALDTDWVMTDRRGTPARIPGEFPRLFAEAPPPFEPHRVALPPTPASAASLVTAVRRSDLDPMGHANNGAYIDWIDEAVAGLSSGLSRPVAPPRAFVAEYLAPAGPGAALTGRAWELGDGVVACRLSDGTDELLRARVEALGRP
jgi:acyl-CoA thioesterase FadM